jgi:hypothetical protein
MAVCRRIGENQVVDLLFSWWPPSRRSPGSWQVQPWRKAESRPDRSPQDCAAPFRAIPVPERGEVLLKTSLDLGHRLRFPNGLWPIPSSGRPPPPAQIDGPHRLRSIDPPANYVTHGLRGCRRFDCDTRFAASWVFLVDDGRPNRAPNVLLASSSIERRTPTGRPPVYRRAAQLEGWSSMPPATPTASSARRWRGSTPEEGSLTGSVRAMTGRDRPLRQGTVRLQAHDREEVGALPVGDPEETPSVLELRVGAEEF